MGSDGRSVWASACQQVVWMNGRGMCAQSQCQSNFLWYHCASTLFLPQIVKRVKPLGIRTVRSTFRTCTKTCSVASLRKESAYGTLIVRTYLTVANSTGACKSRNVWSPCSMQMDSEARVKTSTITGQRINQFT